MRTRLYGIGGDPSVFQFSPQSAQMVVQRREGSRGERAIMGSLVSPLEEQVRR